MNCVTVRCLSSGFARRVLEFLLRHRDSRRFKVSGEVLAGDCLTGRQNFFGFQFSALGFQAGRLQTGVRVRCRYLRFMAENS